MNNDEDIKKEENFEDVSFVDSTEDGDELPTKDKVKKLREDLKTCQQEKSDYLTGWQRSKADYINLQKEMELLKISGAILAKEKMFKNFLQALDSFDMAFGNKEAWEAVDKNWRMGIEYIYQQFTTGLEQSGIEKINAVGVKFDPNLHQSIESITTDDQSKDHTIEKVIQTGYKLGERIIRPARVNIFEFKG
jgi:molecular chaperone GrpE